MSLRRTWSWVFVLLAVVLLSAVGLVSASVLRLERDRMTALAETDRQDSIRSALWRLEGLLAPAIVQEARRPARDYRAFAPQGPAYTRLLHQIRPGDVLTPSPLLDWRSDLFPLHFEVDTAGVVTSPQVPDGNLLDLAVTMVREADLAERRERLEWLRTRLSRDQVVDAVAAGEASLATKLHGPWPFDRDAIATMAETPQQQIALQSLRNADEWTARGRVARNFQQVPSYGVNNALAGAEGEADIGPLIPFWTGQDSTAPGQLLLARRIQIHETETPGECTALYQGVLCDWQALRLRLLTEVADLVPGADLVPALHDSDPGHAGSSRLVAIPIELVAPTPEAVAVEGLTPERATLILLWAATIGGLLAVGVGLRATVVYGEKKSRFASAVTHELRTPLTTFRMYTEMLADDMIEGEERRREFLETLKRESARLSGLVESVLAYARVEQGSRKARLEPMSLSRLLDRVLPELERRAESTGLDLHTERAFEGDPSLRADPDGVALILGNLVDNAGKYAAGGDDQTVRVAVTVHRGELLVDLRDHGPGVPEGSADGVFEAFERGDRSGDPTPGLGLGLSLARALAREMGGDLELIRHGGRGAWFRLTLPLSR